MCLVLWGRAVKRENELTRPEVVADAGHLFRMPPRILLVFCLALVCWAVPASGAGPYDPSVTWRTIVTPRFRVHYPDGARNLGVRVARIAEEEIDRVAELFGY